MAHLNRIVVVTLIRSVVELGSQDPHPNGPIPMNFSIRSQWMTFLPLQLLIVVSASGGMRLSAMEYKELIGSYGIDIDGTILVMKAKTTPENDKMIQEALKGLEKERDKVQFVTFTFNAKTIEFTMDDGHGQISKTINEITSTTPAADGTLDIITHDKHDPSLPAPAIPDHETTMKVYRHGDLLILESHDMPISITKKSH